MRAFLATRQGLLDAVVFSGGEPLSEPRLPAMIRDARRMGFRIGLHTAGIYPLRLADALRHLDWVGLDIKADAQGYDDITGRRESQRPAQACLTLLLASGVDFECRITWHPDWLDETRLLALARELARRGVRRFAVQNARNSRRRRRPRAWAPARRKCCAAGSTNSRAASVPPRLTPEAASCADLISRNTPAIAIA